MQNGPPLLHKKRLRRCLIYEDVFTSKTVVLFACVVLLVSCGRHPDPAPVSRKGDLAAFIGEAISNQTRGPALSNAQPIQTTWHSRVLTDRHKSGEYLEGRQALQVATAASNFTSLKSHLTKQLGLPTLPLREESSGWRHVGWARPEDGLGVWLIEVGDQCRVDVVTEVKKR